MYVCIYIYIYIYTYICRKLASFSQEGRLLRSCRKEACFVLTERKLASFLQKGRMLRSYRKEDCFVLTGANGGTCEDLQEACFVLTKKAFREDLQEACFAQMFYMYVCILLLFFFI